MLELSGIVILGILAQWVAWRFKIPAILPLILVGLFVGPIATLLTSDGTKWIEPIWNGSNGLFPGESLFYFVSLAISVILFEGGLTLKLKEFTNVGPVITKLITLGSVVTFFGAGIAVHYLFDLSWQISFLFSGLIIVTGPTVITPILRNIPLKKDVSAVLKWEGILIDPIGALVAVLVFEFISVGGGSDFTSLALVEFGKIILFGSTFGFTFANGLKFVLSRKLVPHYLLNVFVLATVLGVFVLSDSFAHDSGLLSVVVMGMVLGNSRMSHLKELLYFKESLSVLLISILFILLAANINIDELKLIYRYETLYLLGAVVFIIRPLGVFMSASGSSLKIKEKLFISWVGPRGIVAAGIASLFGLELANNGVEGAEYITPLVFMIVLGTVLLNATTARNVSKILGVYLKKTEGILIIGASDFPRILAEYLERIGKSVVLIDSNKNNIRQAEKLGLTALNVDIYSDELVDDIELNNIGFLIGLTVNDDINRFAIRKYRRLYGENGAYRLPTPEEVANPKPNKELISFIADFITLAETVDVDPLIYEEPASTVEEYQDLMKEEIIPLFIKYPSNKLEIITGNEEDYSKLEKGTTLVFLSKSEL
ncbi:MAG: cation:proton antiporter [Flavobacteriaceae bacterium]